MSCKQREGRACSRCGHYAEPEVAGSDVMCDGCGKIIEEGTLYLDFTDGLYVAVRGATYMDDDEGAVDCHLLGGTHFHDLECFAKALKKAIKEAGLKPKPKKKSKKKKK